MNKTIRIGNIEYHKEKGKYVIDCYYQNKYYGSEDELKSNGWIFDKDGNASKGNSHLSGSMFKSEFCRYMIAEIIWNSNYNGFDVLSVGKRCFELDKEDYKDFLIVLDILEKKD